MKRATHAPFAGPLRPVLVLFLLAGAWPVSPLLAVPPDGTYAGTTDQGRSISLVVAGGQILSWTVSYQCPGFTSTTTVNTGSCFILGNSFICGSTFCSPFVATTRVSGTFTGTSVAGSLNVRHTPNQFSSCCALTNRSWSGARSCAAIGDSDSDGVCDDLDVCPGFNDNVDSDGDGTPDGCDACTGDDATGDSDGDGVCNDTDVCAGFDDNVDSDFDGVPEGCDVCAGFDDHADGDGDGVPDGCDLCLGDDASGDIDMDGLCEDVDLCVGNNATGDMDADGVCADLDCDDNDPVALAIDNCGICGGDDSTCAIFSDGFESGDITAWNH